MRKIALLAASVGLLTTGAMAADNPFLKPEVRKPAAPVVQTVSPVNSPSTSSTPEAQAPSAVVGAKLIAIINGEEVWLKDEDKTYVRQKARDESRIILQEASKAAPAPAPLPVVKAGRPNKNIPKRK